MTDIFSSILSQNNVEFCKIGGTPTAMMNQLMSMFMRKQKKGKRWGIWMSVLAALGIGATAMMAKGKNGALMRSFQPNSNADNSQ
jgi:hypothetical protein